LFAKILVGHCRASWSHPFSTEITERSSGKEVESPGGVVATALCRRAGYLVATRHTKGREIFRADYKVNLKAELEIRHLREKIDHLLRRQYNRLFEIQQSQIELLEELGHNRKSRFPSVSFPTIRHVRSDSLRQIHDKMI
jgi:hypothetical protein